MRTVCPLLIHNASQHPDYAEHPAVSVGLNRYLGVPIYDPQGQVIGTLCFVDEKVDQILGEADIQFMSLLAMRVNAEIEREKVLKEHRAHAERLAELNARLVATAEEKRRFVAMVIHDLRHPLTALQTVFYLLRDEEDPAERKSYIDLLENRVRALGHLLESLRQYNEIEAGHIRLNVEQVPLTERLRLCVEEFAPAFMDDAVRLECHIPDDLGEAWTDCDKMHHVLLNLLSNALKFTPKGTVCVRASQEGVDHWALEVEDTGIGMRPEELRRIFDEFYRAPEAETQGRRGSGLGLTIVRQFVSVLQGQVTVRSAPGAGTCFRILFPRRLTLPEETEEPS
jgi:signal transduction histidine kinase